MAKSINRYLDYIFDGSMGTYYAKKTGLEDTGELANILDSQIIIDIHKEYIDAGVNAIKTNTFGLNSLLVKEEIYRNLLIKKAISNAKEAIKDKNVEYFGCIGPINISEENPHEYLDIVKVFEREGTKNFIFETLLEYDNVKEAIRYIKKYIKDSKVIVSFATNEDGYTKLGHYYQKLIEQASIDADYVGLNCLIGPIHMYELAKKLDTNKYNISIMPNAGYPDPDSLVNFENNENYFADNFLKIASLDVKILGGCCGTTPSHIKKSIEKINTIKIEYIKPILEKKKKINKHSSIKSILNSKTKLIAAEIEPPNSIDVSNLYEMAYYLKDAGAHILTFVDSPLAKTRADSLMIATKIKKEIDIHVLPHLTCRDKNQISIKGGLIAANIEGVNNIFALSGDAIAKIDRDFTKSVFALNSIDLINYINELNSEVFFNNPYLIAGALNVNATNFEAEINRALKKIDNNVDYFITQAIFSDEAIENLKTAKKILKKPIVAGLYPVASYKNALFLKNEVKGINIPDDFIQRLANTDPEFYQKVSVDYVCDIINKCHEYCDGYYISTPLKKTNYVLDVIKHIKKVELAYENTIGL